MTNPHNTAQPTETTDRRRIIFNLVARGLDGLMRLDEVQDNLHAMHARLDPASTVPDTAELSACVVDQQQRVETVSAELAGLLWTYFAQLGVDGVLAEALAEHNALRASRGGAA